MNKKIIAVLAITSLGIGAAFAQPKSQKFENKSPEEIAEMKTERMTKHLELTSEQSAQVHDIFLESATSRIEIQEKYPVLKEAKAEMREFKKETKARVQEILTSEQQDKAKELRDAKNMKMKRDSKKGKREFNIEQKLESMKTNLDLTDSQVEELTQVFEKNEMKREEIQAKYPELEAARKEMQKNREDTQKQLESVLTPEQLKRMNQGGSKNGRNFKHGKKGMR